MKTRLLDSPAKRIPIVVTIVIGLILVIGAVYIFHGSASSRPANVFKILEAARTYTRTLRGHNLPVPQSVPLQVFIDQGLLQPGDAGPFQGLDAEIYLYMVKGAPPILMRVHMTDGTDLFLLANGSVLGTKR